MKSLRGGDRAGFDLWGSMRVGDAGLVRANHARRRFINMNMYHTHDVLLEGEKLITGVVNKPHCSRSR